MPFQQFTTPDVTTTDRIGYHFGEVFYAPLLGANPQKETLIVASYGPMGSGKTPFSTAFLNRDETYFNVYTAVLQSMVRAPLENGELRYNDFTTCCADPRAERWDWQSKMQSSGGLCLKAKERIPVGIDLLEHTPLPHLFGADLVLLAAVPGASAYYETLGQFFKTAAQNDLPPASSTTRNGKDLLAKMATWCDVFAKHRQDLDKSSKAAHHSFRLVLVNEGEEITKRFKNFQPTQAKEASIPPRHHPNLGRFVVEAGMM